MEDYDEACGVSLEFLEFSPDAADIALMSGQTDVGYFGYNSWAGSSEKTDALALLAPLQAEHGTLFVPEASSAKSLEDLKGERIALLPPVSGQYQDFKLLVAKMGMDLESDFEPVTGPPPAIEAFLKRGEVGAAILFEPNATNLELEGGYRSVLSLNQAWLDETGEPLHMLGVTANRDWLEGHEEEAQCVVEAVHNATEALATDDSVYDELRDVLGAKDDEHVSKLAENLGQIYATDSVAEASEAVTEQLQEAERLGVIPSVPKPVFTDLGG